MSFLLLSFPYPAFSSQVIHFSNCILCLGDDDDDQGVVANGDSGEGQKFLSSEIFESKSISSYDWYSVYQSSTLPDFSDFKKFVRFDQDEVIGNGHRKVDFIVQCSFDGYNCAFQSFQHPSFGNCFTFNAKLDPQNASRPFNDPVLTSKVGSENGLSITVFLDYDEYIGVLGQMFGINVVVHNMDEYPPLMTKGTLVQPGTATRFTIRVGWIETKFKLFVVNMILIFCPNFSK